MPELPNNWHNNHNYHPNPKIMKYSYMSGLLAIVFLISGFSQLQAQEISGTITEADTDEPLPGASVVVMGTQIGAATNIDGEYTLTVPSLQDTLVVSMVGFAQQTVPIDGREVVNIEMEATVLRMDDVVFIGYGEVRQDQVTAAVSSLSPDDLNIDPSTSTDMARTLQGQVTGLTVTTPRGGDPNQSFELRLRGVSSISAGQEPLVVVDGVPGADFNQLNPGDISSIDVLKGASGAAIYGSRGTNGVIVVETRDGEMAEALGYNVTYSSQVFTETVHRQTEMLSAEEYIQAGHDLGRTVHDYGFDTNWFDEIQRDPTFSHSHNLAVEGGSSDMTYRLSGSYTDHQGLFINTDRKQYRANLNLTQRAMGDRLLVRAQLGAGETVSTPTDDEAYRQAMNYNPTQPVYVGGDSDNDLFEDYDAWEYVNPVGVLRQRTADNKSSRYHSRVTGNFSPTQTLTFTIRSGYEVQNGLDGFYRPSYSHGQVESGTFGYASRTANRSETLTFEATGEWNQSFNEHEVNVVGGYSYQDFTYEGSWMDNTNFMSDAFDYNNMGAGTYLEEGLASLDTWKSGSELAAYFGRVRYNYDARYSLTASTRYEGSTKFGAGNKWGVFPAVSAGWTISNEDFMAGVDWLNHLRLRGGYGVTGNQDFDPYQSLVRMAPSGFFFFDGQYQQSYSPVSNPNPDLRWETKYEYNIGLHWEVVDGRVGGVIDLYNRRTEDLLHNYDVPVPPNLFSTTFANVGTMRNRGIELEFNTIPILTEDLRWNVDFGVNYRTQELVSLSDERFELEFHDAGWLGAPGVQTWTHRYGEGQDMGNFHGYVFEEIDENGQWVFAELETDDDRTIIGNGIPDWYLNFNTRVSYQNWDFRVMMRGEFGHDILNAKRLYYENPGLFPNNLLADYNSELRQEPQFSDYYLERGDWVKVDNITIGYNFPLHDVPSIHDLRVYFSGRNLFTFTASTVNDPELSFGGGLTPGVSGRWDYPTTRTFTLGVEVKL